MRSHTKKRTHERPPREWHQTQTQYAHSTRLGGICGGCVFVNTRESCECRRCVVVAVAVVIGIVIVRSPENPALTQIVYYTPTYTHTPAPPHNILTYACLHTQTHARCDVSGVRVAKTRTLAASFTLLASWSGQPATSGARILARRCVRVLCVCACSRVFRACSSHGPTSGIIFSVIPISAVCYCSLYIVNLLCVCAFCNC